MNKHKIVSAIIASCIYFAGCFPLNAQLVINWQNCINQETRDIYAYDICKKGDNFLIACDLYKDASYNYRLIQLNKNGNFINEFNYGGSYSDLILRIVPATQDCYYLAGLTLSTDGDVTYNPYPTSYNFWIVKIDSLGNKLWDKVLGGTKYEDIFDATATLDGGIVAMGSSNSFDGDISNPQGAWDIWAIKLDSAGNKCWDFSLGSSAFEDGNGIIATSDSGFILMGAGEFKTDGNISCTPPASSYKGLLAKIDKNGIMQWNRCYGGTYNTFLYRALEIDDGYIIGGTTACDDGDMIGSGYHPGYISGHPTLDMWISKMDFEGNIIWQKCYGGTKGEYLSALKMDAQGNLLAAGITSSFNGDVTGNHSISEYYTDIWLFKVNIENGQLLWQQCFGGNGRDEITHGLVQKNDSTWVIAGTSQGPASGNLSCSPPDMEDFTKYYIWTFEFTDTNLYVSAAKPQAVQVSIKPNPVKDWVEVVYVLPATSQKAVLKITDIAGRIIYAHTIVNTQGQHLIDLRQFAPGAYLVTVETGNQKKTVKFVKVN